MKKILIAFLVVLVFISLVGCRNQNNNESLRTWMSDTKKIKVLTTVQQIGDLVEAIGSERVDSWTLIQGALDPHSYELVKGDGEKLERANLIFYNGLGLEHGASLSQWLHTSSKATGVGDWILENHPKKILYRGSVIDPHIWMDISIWKLTIPLIVDRLSQIDPDSAPLYQKNGRQLLEQMEKTDQEIFEHLHRIPADRRYLVTSHDAFHYFTRRYLADSGEADWQSRFAAPEGLAPDGQLSPVDIQRIIDYMKMNRISVIFPESNVSLDSIRKISSAGKESGLNIRVCNEKLYSDAMEENLHYLDMMRHNAETIEKYL